MPSPAVHSPVTEPGGGTAPVSSAHSRHAARSGDREARDRDLARGLADREPSVVVEVVRPDPWHRAELEVPPLAILAAGLREPAECPHLLEDGRAADRIRVL